MKKYCDEIQMLCRPCKEKKEEMEVNHVEGWQQPLMEYLEAGALPLERIEAERIKKKAERYFTYKGELLKRSFTGEVLKCIQEGEKSKVLGEVHQGVCGRHQGGLALW